MIYQITPVPKPRQTRRDKWAQRPAVLRYRAFADECSLNGVCFYPGDSVTFYMPMPKSWSKAKKVEHAGKAHTQKPDLDNLIKALLDALYEDDSVIWRLSASKRWGIEGCIEIEQDE